MKPSPSSRRRGFTLAELMVVVVILGLLATLVVRNVVPALFEAKHKLAKAEIMNISQAVQSYLIKNGRLPESLEPLVTPDENGVTYIDGRTEIPVDPWGFPYHYEADPNGMTYTIGSLGKDGEPGGDGDSADISNKTIANERTATERGR
ncbi:MAG: type II secretion system major pseudopilin GspG [Planctomycetes bacterium]|nr:type II secretion system major pseudopilin GspG [Planctomycetota bacterium]